MEETKDKERAKKLLQASIANECQDYVEDTKYKHLDPNWNRDPSNVVFTTHLMNGRNELYPDPFDEFDPHHSIMGKKAFQVTRVKSL
jgi:hypothetical protein